MGNAKQKKMVNCEEDAKVEILEWMIKIKMLICGQLNLIVIDKDG